MNPNEVIRSILLNTKASNDADRLATEIVQSLNLHNHEFAPKGWTLDYVKRADVKAGYIPRSEIEENYVSKMDVELYYVRKDQQEKRGPGRPRKVEGQAAA